MTWAPRVLSRAVVQRPRLQTTLRASVQAVDQLFSDFGPFGPDAKFPFFLYGDLGSAAPQMTADTKATPIPVLYGEKSDAGAIDPITSAVNPKGLIPGVYLGQFDIDGLGDVGTGLPTTDDAGIGSIDDQAPLGGPGNWIEGTKPRIYGARVVGGVLGPVDETSAATPAPDGTVSGIRHVWNDTGPADYYVSFMVPATVAGDWHPIDNPYPGSNIRYQIISATASDPYPDWQFIAWWTDVNDGISVDDPPESASEWGIISFGYGPWFQFTQIFGSDLGGGDPENKHDRTELDIATRSGSDLLVPGTAPCPFTTFTLTNDDGRDFDLACIAVRGPLLQDHLAGVVNITANGIGLMDPDGLPIVEAFPVVQHWLEVFVHKKKTSDLNVTTSTAPKWRDGVPMVRSSSFTACQAFTASEFGGDGILASWYPDTQASTAEWASRLMAWLEFKLGQNQHGQFVAFMFDPAVDTSSWPRINHVTDVFGDITITSGEGRENVVRGVCDYDPDASKFRNGIQTLRSATAITKYKDKERPGDIIENAFIADDDQLTWLLQRRLDRLANGTRLIELTGPVGWLDYDVGDGVLLTSEDGPGADGYEDQPCIILRQRYNFSTRLVTFTLWDVGDLLDA